MTPEELAAKLGKHHRHATGIMATCPAHEDNEPSLNICEKEGKILLHCHTGCAQDDVIEALRHKGLWNGKGPISERTATSPQTQSRKLIATYEYTDSSGKLLFSSLKFNDPKRRFSYNRPDPSDPKKKIWNLNGTTLVPYNLVGISESKLGICIVEGEKDVESLKKLGITATTSPCGAGKWKPDYNKWFVGRDIYVLPDNDPIGMLHAQDVLCNLKDIARSLRLIILPDLPAKGDVSDWISSGGTKQQLVDIVRKTRIFKPIIPEKTVTETIQFAPPVVIEFLHPKASGKPLSTPENLQQILKNYGVKCCQNVIKKTNEITIKDMAFSTSGRNSEAMTEILGFCRQHHFPKDDLREYISRICGKNAYNPVTNWIDSSPWDEQDRFSDLLNSLGANDPVKATPLLRKWLISCVSSAFTPGGISARGVLVLQGKQHAGKTYWFRQLVADHLDFFQEGLLLDPQSKDSVKSAISSWISEIGELDATFRKSDLAQLKAFIGKSSDEMRLPYGHESKFYARQTVFCGTVNDPVFLNDATGNTRFWSICVGDKINSYHKIDMQQLWAQMKAAWIGGESWILTREELIELGIQNQKHETSSQFEELIKVIYDMTIPDRTHKQATEICRELGYKTPSSTDVRQCGAALRKLFGAPRKMETKTGWMMPDIIVNSYGGKY